MHNLAMQLEYFENETETVRPVLLLFGDDPNEAAAVRKAIAELPSAEPGHEIRIDQLAGVSGVSGTTLAAVVGQADIGTEPIERSARAFRCVLTPESWLTAAGLIEPFTEPRSQGADYFQYLADAGSVEWIISTSRRW
jgi:hypothetical protein